MDGNQEFIDDPANEMDSHLEDQESLVADNQAVFDTAYNALKEKGEVTAEMEEVIRLARRLASAKEGLNWMNAAVDTSFPPQTFNSLVKARQEVTQGPVEKTPVDFQLPD